MDLHIVCFVAGNRLALRIGVTTMKKNREEALQVCLEEFGLASKNKPPIL